MTGLEAFAYLFYTITKKKSKKKRMKSLVFFAVGYIYIYFLF